MRSFIIITTLSLVLLAASAAEAFVSPSQHNSRLSNSRPTKLTMNALDDLIGKVVVESSTAASGGSSAVDMSAVIDPNLLMGGGAVLAVLAIGAAVLAKSQDENNSTAKSPAASPEPEPEPIDVSIPYDAAALYAYQTQVNKNGNYLDKEFQTFKEMYYDMSVAEVILKQKERKLQEIKDKMESLYPSNA